MLNKCRLNNSYILFNPDNFQIMYSAAEQRGSKYYPANLLAIILFGLSQLEINDLMKKIDFEQEIYCTSLKCFWGCGREVQQEYKSYLNKHALACKLNPLNEDDGSCPLCEKKIDIKSRNRHIKKKCSTDIEIRQKIHTKYSQFAKLVYFLINNYQLNLSCITHSKLLTLSILKSQLEKSKKQHQSPPISDQMEIQIQDKFESTTINQNQQLSEDDLSLLKDQNLNNKLINYYLNLYVSTNSKDKIIKVFDVSFSQQLLFDEYLRREENYQEQSKIVEQLSIFQMGAQDQSKYKLFFIPICYEQHWSLMVFRLPCKQYPSGIFYYLDSGRVCSPVIKKALQVFFNKKYSTNLQNVRQILFQKQTSERDSGIYLIRYAIFVIKFFREFQNGSVSWNQLKSIKSHELLNFRFQLYHTYQLKTLEISNYQKSLLIKKIQESKLHNLPKSNQVGIPENQDWIKYCQKHKIKNPKEFIFIKFYLEFGNCT